MANDDPAQAMIDWANSVPPAELAVELMPAFGPDQLGRPATGVYESHVGAWLFRGYTHPGRYATDVATPVREAVQLLEHAELVYIGTTGRGTLYWTATRLGLAILANGKAAVRQRIKDRTGL